MKVRFQCIYYQVVSITSLALVAQEILVATLLVREGLVAVVGLGGTFCYKVCLSIQEHEMLQQEQGQTTQSELGGDVLHCKTTKMAVCTAYIMQILASCKWSWNQIANV